MNSNGWRLLKLAAGRFRPAPTSRDVDEARMMRRTQERGLHRCVEDRPAVEAASRAAESDREVDELAWLIEQAFTRRGE